MSAALGCYRPTSESTAIPLAVYPAQPGEPQSIESHGISLSLGHFVKAFLVAIPASLAVYPDISPQYIPTGLLWRYTLISARSLGRSPPASGFSTAGPPDYTVRSPHGSGHRSVSDLPNFR